MWLGCVVFLPFPTALVATVGHQSLTQVLYFGTMAASGLSLTLLSWSVNRAPEIREPDPDYRDHVLINATITAYFVLALGVPLLLPWSGTSRCCCCSSPRRRSSSSAGVAEAATVYWLGVSPCSGCPPRSRSRSCDSR